MAYITLFKFASYIIVGNLAVLLSDRYQITKDTGLIVKTYMSKAYEDKIQWELLSNQKVGRKIEPVENMCVMKSNISCALQSWLHRALHRFLKISFDLKKKISIISLNKNHHTLQLHSYGEHQKRPSIL